MQPLVTIRPYSPDDANAFRDLNLAWIEQYFTVEPSDRAQLDDPQAHIVGRGGRILIAQIDGAVVGTVGLVPAHDPGTVELIKMSARPDVHGQGVGKALMAAAIVEAGNMGASQIWLETNTILFAALALYRKAGFRELTGDEISATPYARCNCQMVLGL